MKRGTVMVLEVADGLSLSVRAGYAPEGYSFGGSKSMATAIDGTRHGVRSQRAARDISLTMEAATPSQVGVVEALAHGEFGDGPFRLVDTWAAQTNVLSAHVSTLGHFVGNPIGGVSMSGPALLDDGSHAGRSLVGVSGGVSLTPGASFAAVAPGVGEWVTGSVYASPASGSTVQVGLIWYQPTNGFSYGPLVTRDASGSVLRRVSASGVVPASITPAGGVAGLVSRVGLRVVGASRVTRPAISWTPAMTEWGVGASPRLVRLSLDAITPRSGSLHGTRVADVKLTAQEVGAP